MSTNVEARPKSMLHHLFVSQAPVSRRSYLSTGFSLMALKYAVEGAIAYALTGTLPSPIIYLAPIAKMRIALLGASPPAWILALLLLWTLPFAWIGVTMSVRRARDAGLHPAVGLGFLLPFINYFHIAVLASLPTRDGSDARAATSEQDRPLRAALLGVFVGALYLIPVAAIGLLLGENYGAGIFLGAPLLSGALAGFFYCRDAHRSAVAAVAIGVATQLVAAALMVIFALEGFICIFMAMPIAMVIGAVGGLLGRSIAGVRRRNWHSGLSAPMLLLPMLIVAEPSNRVERVVTSSVEVDAAPDAVWDVVVAFPEIPTDTTAHWLFRAGVAMPLRARIEGNGVGAVRHCEFTTGAFVEPITVWDKPRHLAFDVTAQPEPMREMSPWPSVLAPHIANGTLRSHRGEFVLEPLPGGRTRLIGRTWYSVDMAPEPYWASWVDWVVHEVHLRVLSHIADVAATQPVLPVGLTAPIRRDTAGQPD